MLLTSPEYPPCMRSCFDSTVTSQQTHYKLIGLTIQTEHDYHHLLTFEYGLPTVVAVLPANYSKDFQHHDDMCISYIRQANIQQCC